MADLHVADSFALDTARFQDEGLRVGIFASPGAGKGYLLGVLLEELIEAGYPCVMVDPESELWTFREIGALIVGGQHGHVPLPSADARGVVEEALRFSLSTATPVVFDLGGAETEAEIRELFELIARPYWRIVSEERHPSVFAVTEAHVLAPQSIPRGEKAHTTLSAILNRGRKRGVTVALETQRIADVANAVISHCNVRFVGRIDFEDDFKRVAKGLPGVSFSEVQALERGTFYVPRLSSEPIQVRARRVTHGGGTPAGGEITLRREHAPKALADVAKRLAGLAESAPEEEQAPPRRRAAKQQDTAAVERAERQVAEVQERARAAEERASTAERDLAAQRDGLDRLDAFRRALLGLFDNGDLPAAAEGGGYPGDEHVVGLIRQHAGRGAGGGVTVQPVEALRKRYLEQTANRLADTITKLGDDEREVLLFLIGRQAFVTINAVAKALSGSDSGSVRNRWSGALKQLNTLGLVAIGGSGRTSRRENIDAWVQSELGPHAPTDAEVAAVRDRALALLQSGA